MITLFFTLCFSVFLIAYLDWWKLLQCKDDDSCEPNLQGYIIHRVSLISFCGPFYLLSYLRQLMDFRSRYKSYLITSLPFLCTVSHAHPPSNEIQPFHQLSFWNFIVIIYIVLFSAYGIFSTISFVSTVRNAFESKYIFEDKLGISTRKLEGGAVEWHEVVQKLLNLQREKSYRVAHNGQDIKDELVIAQRIMRRENFMVAFFNRNMLDLTVSSPSFLGFSSERMFYSKSLEVRRYSFFFILPCVYRV